MLRVRLRTIALPDAKHDERIRIKANDEDKAVKTAKGCGCALVVLGVLILIAIIALMCG